MRAVWIGGGAAMLLGACVPIPVPHTVTEQPKIEGTLREGALPLGGVPVRVAISSEVGCAGEGADTVTDADGHFSFDRKDEERMVMWMPAVPVYEAHVITVCADRGDGFVPVFADSEYTLEMEGLGPLPKEYRLDCEVAAGGNGLSVDTCRADTAHVPSN